MSRSRFVPPRAASGSSSEEVRSSWNQRVRQLRRPVSIASTGAVVVHAVAMVQDAQAVMT
ncbi:MAG: hypothetical protein KIS78_17330 [Labilithrix sp.]|nr:hypothetical protein [Labilithrix sp.]MCW5834164.1 hypothetical protein [Labilithrix sp.]